MAVRPDLDGVSETALWTLWYRALAAQDPGAVLNDPVAVELVERLDYPFAQRFGRLFPAQARVQAMRVLAFDDRVERFLEAQPGGTVVALGEGLETQFWRVDNGTVRWLTVDLPASIRLRRRLLPRDDRRAFVAGSALDLAWADAVDPRDGVLITAQGLLMYLPPEQVYELLGACAARFPGARMVFDAVPRWMAGLVRHGTPGYQPPPLRWTLEPAQLRHLTRIVPGVEDVTDVRPPSVRGVVGWLAPRLRYVPVLRRLRPMVVEARFASGSR